MFPYITVFGKDISLYAIMVIVGVLCSGSYIIKMCKKKNIDDNKAITILLFSCIGVFFGGHILYGLTNIKLIYILINNFDKISSFKMFIQCLMEIFGGSVFYGGLIGGLIVGFFALRKSSIDKEKFCDIVAPAIPLFHFFGRIGCFLVGCCYGIESHFGLVFRHSMLDSANNVSRFPVQILEALFNLILFIILAVLNKKDKFKGKLIYIYLILYSIIRFSLEFLRGDTYRGFIFGLSTSQWISIFLFLIASIILIIKRKNNN